MKKPLSAFKNILLSYNPAETRGTRRAQFGMKMVFLTIMLNAFISCVSRPVETPLYDLPAEPAQTINSLRERIKQNSDVYKYFILDENREIIVVYVNDSTVVVQESKS